MEFEFVSPDEKPLGRAIEEIAERLAPHRSFLEDYSRSGGRVDLRVDFLIRTGVPKAVLHHEVAAQLGGLGIDLQIEMVVDRESWAT